MNCCTVFFHCIILYFCLTLSNCADRYAKSLIFPPTSPTRTQFIYGIGIPLELDTESLTTGYVLKAEYFLPTRAEELRPTELHPQSVNKRSVIFNETAKEIFQKINTSFSLEKKKEFNQNNEKLSSYRWSVYKVIETIINRAGYNGKICILRVICESAQAPFFYHSGILGEILHILMSPLSSIDIFSHHSDNKYIIAEMIGNSKAICAVVYKECKISFIDKFSAIYAF